VSPTTAAVVLAHSPLTDATAWGALPDVLRSRGREVVVLDVTDDDGPPYASRYVARAALQVRDALGGAPAVLVGHSGAGYLLPLLGAARRAARARVSAYLFLDAGLPPGRPASRLDLLRVEVGDAAPELAAQLGAHLAGGGTYPDWTDQDLRAEITDDSARAALLRSIRPRGEAFFTEPVPVAPDWPEAPCGFLRLSSSYDGPARQASLRGWPVTGSGEDRPGGHFAAVVEPDRLADDLEALLTRL
jgi:pimeloyl-ACP methyl ester carboxylesterase